MNQEVAKVFYSFFNSFGLPAFVTNFVAPDAKLPYITYDLAIGDTFGSTLIGCKLWYNGKLPTKMFETSDKIAERLKNNLQLKCGNGYLYLSKGEPFAQVVADENPDISSMYINIAVTYDLN